MFKETMAEVVTDSGAERPSGSVSVEPGTMNIIATFLARRALVIAEAGNDPALSSDALLEFAKPAAQHEAVLDLIEKIRPTGVDLDLWLAWIDGGTAPIKVLSVDRPIDGRRTPPELLDRRGKTVIRIEKQIAAAKRAAALATTQAAELESELLQVRAANSAILEFAIFEKLTAITKSSLAVGPLWTFVRAIGAHDPEGERDMSNLSPSFIKTHAFLAESRQADTTEIFQCLDFMAGDKKFEADLRDVILDLAVSRRAEIEERKKAGERVRPMAKIKTSMNGASRQEVAHVVSTLPGA